jgi:hypothetical protein
MMHPFMHLGTEHGDLEIREDDLSSVTDKELKKLRISREELRRCFAEAMEMMRGATQGDWARHRPTCEETLDGKWVVSGPIGYSQFSHPLMQGKSGGRA